MPELPSHVERQDPEVPAPRRDHRCVMTASTEHGRRSWWTGCGRPFGRYGGGAGRRPPGRPRRPRAPRAHRPAAVGGLGTSSTTCCSAAPTRPARTTATSPGWRRCWPDCRSRRRAARSTGSAGPAWTPIAIASRAVRSGDADLVLAGGVESMTRAPFVMPKATSAFSRTAEIHDTTIGWRFVNPVMREQFGTDSMPETAENVAERVRHRPGRPGRVRAALAGTDRQGDRRRAGWPGRSRRCQSRSGGASRWSSTPTSTRGRPRWRRWPGCSRSTRAAPSPPGPRPGSTTARPRC